MGGDFVDASMRSPSMPKEKQAALPGRPHVRSELQGLRRWALLTKDAHGLYAQLGFVTIDRPERHMERTDRDVYTRAGER